MEVGDQETVFEHEYSRETFTISTSERKYRERFAKLAREYPDDVKLVSSDPYNNAVVYHVPENWVSVRRPRQVNLSPEFKEAMSQKMQAINRQRSADKHKGESDIQNT